VLAAALGIINTTMMSVQERRHELGLIRAVGATRRQVRSVVMGEAALMGLVGAIIGVIAGAGMTIIFVVTYGGNSVGLDDLPLWSTALEVLRPVLVTGIVGLIVAPLISALSAWLPTRNLLKGAAIETLHPVR
jgi:putative ABC transport system permease protein